MATQRSDDCIDVPAQQGPVHPATCASGSRVALPAWDLQLLEQLRVVVAAAAADAVRGALAELRPLLLEAVAPKAQEGVERRSTLRQPRDRRQWRSAPSGHATPCEAPRAESASEGGRAAETPRAADRGRLERRASSSRDGSWRAAPSRERPDAEEPAGERPGSERTEASWGSAAGLSVERASSEPSVGSTLPSPVATLYSVGQPTVQSLQVDLAMAFLHSSAYGSSLRGTNSSSSQRQSRNESDTSDFLEVPGGATSEAASLTWASVGPGPLPHHIDASAASPRRSPPSPPGYFMGSHLRDLGINELAQVAVWDSGSFSSENSAPRVVIAQLVSASLCWMGFARPDTLRSPLVFLVYQWLARSCVLLSAAVLLLPVVGEAASLSFTGGYFSSCKVEVCWHQGGFISFLSLAFGAVLTLLPLGLRRHQVQLEQTLRLLRAVSVNRGCVDQEMCVHLWEISLFGVLWLSTIAGVGWSFDAVTPAMSAIHVCAIAIASAAILCLCSSMVYICRSLVFAVDSFARDAARGTPLNDMTHAWNLTQATLRKAAADVERCLLVLIVTVAIAVPMLIADRLVFGASVALLLPGLIVSCGIAYALFMAGAVSEKCQGVPALVSGISFGPGTERARQRTADWIATTAAGVYIFGARLTTSSVIKAVYTCCIALIVVGLVASEQ